MRSQQYENAEEHVWCTVTPTPPICDFGAIASSPAGIRHLALNCKCPFMFVQSKLFVQCYSKLVYRVVYLSVHMWTFIQLSVMSPSNIVRYLADRTAHDYWHNVVVCLSVMKCIVGKRYVVQQKCLKKWMGSAP